MRVPIEDEGEMGVMMTPLIDCVFLLLIFFLVTTMMKKWEKQIPIELPDITSSLSVESKQDASVIALDDRGRAYELVSHNTYSGETAYRPIDDVLAYLSQLRAARGNEIPLEISGPWNVPVERVIEVFDLCQLQGFAHTRVRLGNAPYEDPVPQ
mgnify:FL=1